MLQLFFLVSCVKSKVTLDSLEISRENAEKSIQIYIHIFYFFFNFITGIVYPEERSLPRVLSLLPCNAFERRRRL